MSAIRRERENYYGGRNGKDFEFSFLDRATKRLRVDSKFCTPRTFETKQRETEGGENDD